MVKQVAVLFKNHSGLVLRGVVHKPKKYDTTIVLLHGFPSTMDSASKRLATKLSAAGYLCLRFDFSGSGTSEGRFEDKLMSSEIKDIRSAMQFVRKQYPTKHLVLFGHSTGAIDAALYAPTDKKLNAVILSGAVCDLDAAVHIDFTDRQVRDFWTKGFTLKCPSKPKKKRHLWLWRAKRGKIRKAFYDEFFTLDIPKAIRSYHKPLLIMHGEKDEGIPLEPHPKKLYALANKPKHLVIIKGADHSYTTKAHTKLAVAAIVHFLRTLR